MRLARRAALACMLLLTLCAPAFAQEPADLVEGRRLFDALSTTRRCRFSIAPSVCSSPRPAAIPAAARRSSRPSRCARARAFGIGNREGAVADFRALLGLEPGFMLPEGVSPRVVAILDEVRMATIGAIELTLDPADAQLVVDGVPRAAWQRPLVGRGRRAHPSRLADGFSADRSAGDRWPAEPAPPRHSGTHLQRRDDDHHAARRGSLPQRRLERPHGPGRRLCCSGQCGGAAAAAGRADRRPGAHRPVDRHVRRRVPPGLLRHRAPSDLDQRAGRRRAWSRSR